MDTHFTPARILKQIAQLTRMERGEVFKHIRHTGYEFYTHSFYEDGKTHTRYIPKDEVSAIRKLNADWNRFHKLVARYESLIIQRTRAERAAAKAAKKVIDRSQKGAEAGANQDTSKSRYRCPRR